MEESESRESRLSLTRPRQGLINIFVKREDKATWPSKHRQVPLDGD